MAIGNLTTSTGAPAPLLELKNVKKHFGNTKAVDGLSMEVFRGETVGIVGESGCGKTTTGHIIMRIIDVTSGNVIFGGQDITHLQGRKLRRMRRNFQMVFQDPYSSLNPKMSVGALVAEPFIVHRLGDRQQIKVEVAKLLETVGLAADALNRYPHEFSGGQRQRIAIARALALRPALVVADEAVSALDVSYQAQILNLFVDLQKEFGLAYVFISHNLAVIRYVSDRVAVMYLGRIVEMAKTNSLFVNPLHPYTQALLAAAPAPDAARQARLLPSGEIPGPAHPPPGCAYHVRCQKALDICSFVRPEVKGEDGHQVVCHLYN